MNFVQCKVNQRYAVYNILNTDEYLKLFLKKYQKYIYI